MLYKEVARILDVVRSKKGSPKSLVLSSNYKNKKQLFALVCETIKYNDVLSNIIKSSKLREHERMLSSESVAQALVYDLLFGRGVQGPGKLQKAVLRHRASLQAELARVKIKRKVVNNEDLMSEASKLHAQIPRYVRVNLIKTSLNEVVQSFQKEGYELLRPNCEDALSFLDAVKKLTRGQFMPDFHLPDLLVFASGTDLHAHPLYVSGQVILQDKASCMPAFILNPSPGGHVIDCCAAPGNKTSHAASLMKNKGKIFSFDMDKKRLSTMKSLITKAGVACAGLCCQDFLTVDTSSDKYSDVEYIIVDPSCSGSGIVSRQDGMADSDDTSEERLDNLASFQISILKHALSFPNVKRVVYSTCSVHEKENEHVAKQALDACRGRFYLDPVLPTWPHRGHGAFDAAHSCLRFTPGKDMTNGFFVACFQRVTEENGEKVGRENRTHEGRSGDASNGARSGESAKRKLEQLEGASGGGDSTHDAGKGTKRKAKKKRKKKSKPIIS